MTESLKDRYQRPEGRLVERAMKRPPKVSGRKLAEQVGLSEGRIRQIVNGYRTEAGVVLEIEAPTDTLARIAEVLQIGADEMAGAGRADVAAQLRENPRVGMTEDGALWLSDNSEEVAALRVWLNEDEPGTAPPTIALALWEVDELLDAAKAKHRDEMHLLNLIIAARRSKGGDGDADDHEPGGSAPTNDDDVQRALDAADRIPVLPDEELTRPERHGQHEAG